MKLSHQLTLGVISNGSFLRLIGFADIMFIEGFDATINVHSHNTRARNFKFQQTISFSTAVIHNNFDNQQTGDFFLGGHGGFEKGGHDNAGWRATESLLQSFYLFVTY